MVGLKESLAEVQILGYLRIQQDGKVIYFDSVEGNCAGASILRICNLDLKSVPSEPGELIDIIA
jgi:hypothetical protein